MIFPSSIFCIDQSFNPIINLQLNFSMGAHQGVPIHHRQLLRLPRIGRTMPSPTPHPHPSLSTPPLFTPRFRAPPPGRMDLVTNSTKSEAIKKLGTSKNKLDSENTETRVITIEDGSIGTTIADELATFCKKTHKHS